MAKASVLLRYKYGSLVELIDTADGATRFLFRDLIKTLTAEFFKKDFCKSAVL